jgi:hypothetical protein
LENPEADAMQILKFNIFFQLVYVLCTMITKISITLFILRIVNDKRFKWFLWIIMTFMVLSTIAMIAVLMATCTPLNALWDLNVNGTCLPFSTETNVAYLQSSFVIFSDACLTISPVVILWNIRLRRGEKTWICFLMSLGLIATLSNAIRNRYLGVIETQDFTCTLSLRTSSPPPCLFYLQILTESSSLQMRSLR